MERFLFVSVIIPVKNDRDRLSCCLQALQFQTYPHSRYEIVVVDNNSTENIYSLCRDFPRVVYCQESKPGSYAARNQGISVAQGDLIAFTDSDCLPDIHWLEEGVRALLHTEAGIIGGAVEFYFQHAKPNPVEYFDAVFYLQQQRYVQQDHYAVTANLFTRRHVLEKVGGFDDRLLNLGDKEWGQRVHSAGFEVLYCSGAIIQHPARATLKALLKKGRSIARANHWMHKHRGAKPPTYNFWLMGWDFWHSTWSDPNVPTWIDKLGLAWVVHRFKWAVAWELLRARVCH